MTPFGYILFYIKNVLAVTLCAVPFAVIWRLLCVRRLHGRALSSTPWHETGVILLAAFCAALASQTVIPKHFMLPRTALINLFPGRVFWDTYTEAVTRGNLLPLALNFIGNILIFAPLGFLCALCFRGVRAGRIALIGFGASFIAEFCQLFSERCSDIDDLWLNTLGALAGYAVYVLFARVLPRTAAAFHVRPQ